MSETVRPTIDISRGLRGLTFGALGGAFAPFAFAVGLSTYQYFTLAPVHFDLVNTLQDLSIYPFLGCAAICAGAGFATMAAPRNYRFSTTLLIVAVASVALWFAIGGAFKLWEAMTGIRFWPWRGRADADIILYPSEFVVFVVPPLVVAVAITSFRARRETR